MTHDPKYRMKFRPTPIARLSKYTVPMPMAGDPPEARTSDWEKRCKIVYDYMMSVKRGIVPHSARRGVWFYGERQP